MTSAPGTIARERRGSLLRFANRRRGAIEEGGPVRARFPWEQYSDPLFKAGASRRLEQANESDAPTYAFVNDGPNGNVGEPNLGSRVRLVSGRGIPPIPPGGSETVNDNRYSR